MKFLNKIMDIFNGTKKIEENKMSKSSEINFKKEGLNSTETNKNNNENNIETNKNNIKSKELLVDGKKIVKYKKAYKEYNVEVSGYAIPIKSVVNIKNDKFEIPHEGLEYRIKHDLKFGDIKNIKEIFSVIVFKVNGNFYKVKEVEHVIETGGINMRGEIAKSERIYLVSEKDIKVELFLDRKSIFIKTSKTLEKVDKYEVLNVEQKYCDGYLNPEILVGNVFKSEFSGYGYFAGINNRGQLIARLMYGIYSTDFKVSDLPISRSGTISDLGELYYNKVNSIEELKTLLYYN